MKLPTVNTKGFTLIELMVTLALAAILMAVAVPSITTFMRNAELTSFTNSLLAALNAARGEAMKRGRYCLVVPKDGSSWDSGWVVFVDMDRSQTNTSGDFTVLSSDAKQSYITVTGNGSATGTTPYIMYDASGYSRLKNAGFGALTLEVKRNDVSGTEAVTQTRRIKISSTGRPRICTPKTSSDSTCSMTASAN